MLANQRQHIPNLSCQRVDAQAIARRLPQVSPDPSKHRPARSLSTQEVDQRTSSVETHTSNPRSLSHQERDSGPDCLSGTLTGGHDTHKFHLPANIWNLYWETTGPAVSATVILYEYDVSYPLGEVVEIAPIWYRSLSTPFMAHADKEYHIELMGGPAAVVSWYLATQ
ncbi:MAG: hypothetical protein M1830_002173 [Pleopsidium flavum]|nr:MAG: hypothetical protein M1830_002173 [Pleopsidium flavum]